ncbi:MAG: type VI secretion system protein ImpK [Proteobacteria bacterium]|nr:MAG: type VI secretion system protein ImpK [Pseudomonadota bacterium]PIE67002.1 MAG: type VI secretion system protein ImpK [Deltaproteobacteria bacterium]
MRLADCFTDLLAYTTMAVQPAGSGQASFDQVNANIRRLIADSEALCKQGGFDQTDYELARFAVFAWVDETILASGWEGKNRWLGEQLQRHYYQTSDAGKLFFERLNTIGAHQIEVREVFYICLALGFVGQYCHEGDDYLLDQLRISNLKLLTGSSMGVPDVQKMTLFPGGYKDPDAEGAMLPRKKRFSVFTLFFIVAPLMLYGVLFFVYQFILGNIGKSLIN